MTIPFNYNKNAFGGTEYMGRGWESLISADVPKFKDYLSIIIPGVVPDIDKLINSPIPVIIWMHNTPIQFGEDEIKILNDPKLINNIKYVIVPSKEHKRLTLSQIPAMPEDKIVVIPNAINPLKYNPNKFNNVGKVRLINTSSPDRGLDILLNAMSLIEEDFELDIFSRFNPAEFPSYIPDPRINFYGFSFKNTVLKHYESAHIHAYPSTYPETFCISQAEAMSAGLLCVTSDIGALPEISGGHTVIYHYDNDPVKHTQIFAEEISKAIQKIKRGEWNPEAQIEYTNKTYSWERVKQDWVNLHNIL
jgi:glycosyltransferase involved in cell wall biosynthesis